MNGDLVKLRREVTRGVWLAEVNGAVVKVALTFIATAVRCCALCSAHAA